MKVVAVFGGGNVADEVLASAEKVGRHVAKTRWIVLTGASAPDDVGVKGRAIVGCLNAKDGFEHPWIGVPRSEQVRAVRHGSGLVLETKLNHKRNFLEACLCDAAIVFPGDEGTTSEAVSVLCLRKPCVFVGDDPDDWTLPLVASAFDGVRLEQATLEMSIAVAEAKLKKGPGSPLDQLIGNVVRAENLTGLLTRVSVVRPAALLDVIPTLQAMLDRATTIRAFPPLPNDPNDVLRASYDEFVTSAFGERPG